MDIFKKLGSYYLNSGMKNRLLVCGACFLACAITLLQADAGSAHISADAMPDSVAEVEYSIYLEFKPNDLKVRNKLGMVYYRLDRIEEADREFSRILKKEPDNYDALDGMGLVKSARKQYDEAIGLHRKALALNPEDMMIYFHLGSALEKKGMLQEALVEYREALAKYDEQYPSGSDNRNAAEFAGTVKAAILGIESRMKE